MSELMKDFWRSHSSKSPIEMDVHLTSGSKNFVPESHTLTIKSQRAGHSRTYQTRRNQANDQYGGAWKTHAPLTYITCRISYSIMPGRYGHNYPLLAQNLWLVLYSPWKINYFEIVPSKAGHKSENFNICKYKTSIKSHFLFRYLPVNYQALFSYHIITHYSIMSTPNTFFL